MKPFFIKFFLILSAVLVSTMFVASTTFAAPGTYIVDSPNGGTVGTGKCELADQDDCTFEDAISKANGDPGATINFGIDDFILPATYTIPISATLSIKEAVTINGYMQWTSSPNSVAAPGPTNAVMRIVIDGSATGGDCFNIDTSTGTDAVLIKGLVVNNCRGNAFTVIGSNKTIQGNYIGTDEFGTTAVSNGDHGVYVEFGHYNLIGGPNPEDRNVISGNGKSGIKFNFDVSGSWIEGNFIGLDSTGTADLGNGDFGVAIGDMVGGTHSGNVVGNRSFDVGDGKRNYISGNASDGVFIENAMVTVMFRNDQIRNNFIGADVTGTVSIPNDHGGIGISGSTGVSIVQNLVSGNGGNGISLSGDIGTLTFTRLTDLVLNKIGTDASGVNPLANSGVGILLHDGVVSTRIGDGSTASANIIAYNAREGIAINENAAMHITQNSILTNSIFGNGSLGIDLGTVIGPDGITANDLNDADANANEWQNYPLIDSAVYSSGNTTINGTFHSVPSNAGYTLEFYANDAADSSGYGEGQTFIGSITGVNTDALGNYSFSTVFPGNFNGKYITATATDPSDYTSEFGPMTSADLAVTKTSTAIISEGENITFTVTVSNPAGPNDATNVQLIDVNGGAFTYLTSAATQGTFTHTTGVWDVGTLTVGSSAILTINAKVKSCGNIANTASVSRSGQFDPNTADNSATKSHIGIICRPVAGGSGGSGGSVNGSSEDKSTPEEGFAAPEEAGYCAYTLEPKDPAKITRYEFAKMMLEFNCHTFPTEMPAGEKSFSDLQRQTYEDAEKNEVALVMYYALDAGIISGYPDGTLRPNDPVIYAEASKIVFNTVDGSLNTYRPVMSLLPIKLNGSEWFMNYFIFMIDLMWNSDLDPASTISSEDALSIVNFIMEKFPK